MSKVFMSKMLKERCMSKKLTCTILLLGLWVLFGALPAFADDPSACGGDGEHIAHSYPPWSELCKRLENPHFAERDKSKTCESAPETKNCGGCIACCNGDYDEEKECKCGTLSGVAQTGCSALANHDRTTCRTICRSGVYSNGCNGVNDNFKIP